MQQEIEAKYLNTDHAEIRRKLENLGAEPIQPARTMRRYVYDFPDRRLNETGAWVRLRDEGDVVTLTFKQTGVDSLNDSHEVMTEVKDFEATNVLLKSVGLVAESYQETKRETWSISGVTVELDEWPWLPPFIEIEGLSEAAVHEIADKLELDESQKYIKDVGNLYHDTYGVDPDLKSHTKELKFSKRPDWAK